MTIPAPPTLTAIPDRAGRLSDGVLLQATIWARFLGIRILTVDTTVVISPADIDAASATRTRPPTRASPRPARVSPTSARRAAPGLAAAVRNLDEGAELLARSRAAT